MQKDCITIPYSDCLSKATTSCWTEGMFYKTLKAIPWRKLPTAEEGFFLARCCSLYWQYPAFTKLSHSVHIWLQSYYSRDAVHRFHVGCFSLRRNLIRTDLVIVSRAPWLTIKRRAIPFDSARKRVVYCFVRGRLAHKTYGFLKLIPWLDINWPKASCNYSGLAAFWVSFQQWGMRWMCGLFPSAWRCLHTD